MVYEVSWYGVVPYAKVSNGRLRQGVDSLDASINPSYLVELRHI